MCQSCCLPSTMHGDSLMDLCSLDHPLLVNRTFPTLSLRIFLRMHGPLPRQSLRCTCPFLPAEHRPSPRWDWSATQHYLEQRLQLRTPFRGCSHSFMFKPPDLLATQVAPTDTLKLYGSRDVYFRAPQGSLPSPASDMLAVRIGQLTAEDFHLMRFAALSAAPPTAKR